MSSIDYYFDSALAKVTRENVIVWVVVAGAAAILCYLLWRKGLMRRSTAVAIPILVLYLCFVLTITIFERVPGKRYDYKLELFWSYRAILAGTTKYIAENFWNVVLFVPVGGLAAVLLRKHRWVVLLIGLLLSSGIEIIQLITKRGLFEFDDIIHNSLGTLIGLGMYMFITRNRTER